jgi:bifunctional DNA-binding transcriptional regulator/antitoxin component of YhaV-PrlF toxin-antitoxin module
MDDSGRVLVPVTARRLLHLAANDSVLMIADCAPVPSLRIYSLPTAYLALTKKEGTRQNGN